MTKMRASGFWVRARCSGPEARDMQARPTKRGWPACDRDARNMPRTDRQRQNRASGQPDTFLRRLSCPSESYAKDRFGHLFRCLSVSVR